MEGFLEVFGYYDAKTNKWNVDPTVQQLISSLMVIGTFFSSLASRTIQPEIRTEELASG